MSVKYFDKENKTWVAFPGTVGAPGEGAYEIAVKNGYNGTYEEYSNAVSLVPSLVDDFNNIIKNIDNEPTENSEKLVKSGGVYKKISEIEESIKEDIIPIVNNISSEFLKKGDISATADAVLSDETSASVEYNNGVFSFHFNIEKGEKGDQGDPGEGGVTSEDIQDIVDKQTEFEKGINNVLQQLDNKANIADVPTDYVKADTIEGIYDAINNIDTSIDAEELASKLDPDMVAGVVNGSYLIDGSAISDGAIATRHMIANSISGTVITGGTIIGDKIQSDTITTNHIKSDSITSDKVKAGAITAEKISGIPSGMTIMSHSTEDESTWVLRADGSARLGSKSGNKIVIENGGAVTITADNVTGDNIIDGEAREEIDALKTLLNTTSGNVSDLVNNYNNLSQSVAETQANSTAVQQALDAYKTSVNTSISTLQQSYKDVDTGLTAVDSVLNNWKASGKTTINGGMIEADTITAGAFVSGAINTALIEGGGLTGLTIDSGNNRWKLNKDGDGYLAGGSISWDIDGEVTLGDKVTISWNNVVDKGDYNQTINNLITLNQQAKDYTDAAKAELLNSIDGKVDSKYTSLIGSKLTQINANGIYTGTISADKIVGLTIDASQITAGSLTSNIKMNGTDDPVWKINKSGESWFGSKAIMIYDDKIKLRSGVVIDFDGSETYIATAVKTANDNAKLAQQTANEAKSVANSKISASDVVTALKNDSSSDKSDVIAGILNKSKKIEGSAIADGAITTDKIASNYVYTGEVQAGKIVGGKISADCIDAHNIKLFEDDKEFDLYEYIVYQYSKLNYSSTATTVWYEYNFDEHNVNTRELNSITLEDGEHHFGLSAMKITEVTPVSYINGKPFYATEDITKTSSLISGGWVASGGGYVSVYIDGDTLIITKNGPGSMSLKNTLGDTASIVVE